MTDTVLIERSELKTTLLPIDTLKPHEKGSPLYLKMLRKELLEDGVLRYPIVVDEKTLVILDGMHRWLALKSLGYTLIPVILVNETQRAKTRVGRRRIHRYASESSEELGIEKVISAGQNRRLMKPRSTRHFFPFSKFRRIDYPLHLLIRHNAQAVSGYMDKMDGRKCSLAINEWLTEISEELDFLTKRKEEVEQEKSEFLNRVKSIADEFPRLTSSQPDCDRGAEG